MEPNGLNFWSKGRSIFLSWVVIRQAKGFAATKSLDPTGQMGHESTASLIFSSSRMPSKGIHARVAGLHRPSTGTNQVSRAWGFEKSIPSEHGVGFGTKYKQQLSSIFKVRIHIKNAQVEEGKTPSSLVSIPARRFPLLITSTYTKKLVLISTEEPVTIVIETLTSLLRERWLDIDHGIRSLLRVRTDWSETENNSGELVSMPHGSRANVFTY